MKNIKWELIFIGILIILLALCIFIFSGCSFKMVKIEGQPDQCNDYYTLVKLSDGMKGVFSKENTSVATVLTMANTVYAKCETAREELKKQKRFEDCIKIIYGPELLPKQENYKQYADFIDCRDK